MRSSSKFFLLCLAICFSFAARAESLELSQAIFLLVSPTTVGSEAYLEVNYDIDCGGRNSQGLPGLLGTVFMPENAQLGNGSSHIRFNLFQGNHHTLVSLGAVDKEI